MKRLAATVLALGVSACSAPPAQKQTAPPVAITVAQPRLSSLATTTEYTGTVNAVHTASLGATFGGRVVEVSVRVGDRVAAGQVVARLDAAQYAAQLRQAQSGIDAAGANSHVAVAQLNAANARLHLAQTTGDRIERLYRQGYISKQQRDESAAAVETASASVAQAQASVGAAQSAQGQAQAGAQAAAVPLAEAQIVAPFSGIVTSKFVEEGAVVGAGTPIVALQDDSDLELDLTVPEDAAAAVRPGTAVDVKVDALSGARIPGWIRAVVPSDQATLRSVTVKVGLAHRPRLLAGMFARVSLAAASQKNWTVPAGSIVNRAGQDGVFTVSSGTATFVPVTVRGTDGRSAAIDGLHGAGVMVATSGIERLDNGSPVTIAR